ncbi:hypothetical protein NDU88_003264 [Pleurodeles waltl]|uniref:Uncharacterized protein n=1 Tax=Pleurodeles waltl TaxID=8319 RepID=A0AAV7VCV1_PLEWA|nr:hypothetical protein NDU88_003264 [Pleurodeles waltl]
MWLFHVPLFKERKFLSRYPGLPAPAQPSRFTLWAALVPSREQACSVTVLSASNLREHITFGMRPCSQELETPATSHGKAGMECRFPEPCDRDNEDIGNPDERIPDPLPEIHGDEDESALTGNPDIRVPEVIEKNNGLH